MNYRAVNKEVIRLTLPSILANITVPLVGIVDLAITGHLGDAALISGMVIGTMLFDLLYWNMSFLKMSTGGFTAQAYGADNHSEAISRLYQGIITAAAIGLLVFSLQALVVKASFAVLDLSPEVQAYAASYFYVRIWAVPAALMLMAFRGWFIGMQNTMATMIVDVYVNLSNAGLSYLFAVPMKMGIEGVALGTVFAQWTGLLLATCLLLAKYRNMLGLANVREVMRWAEVKSFFTVSGNHFIKSCCMQVVYMGFTIIATRYGDTQIALSSIMLKVLLLFSYFMDGFAYAAQAMVGRFVGAGEHGNVRRTIHVVFIWGAIIAVVFTILYGAFDSEVFKIFTNDENLISAGKEFVFWLLLMPAVSAVAFTWDGIFAGALAVRQMMITMIISSAAFIGIYFAFEGLLGIQSLYLAYFAHLVLRSLIETLYYFFDRTCQCGYKVC